MPSYDLYSDPFLNRLALERPDLSSSFFEMIRTAVTKFDRHLITDPVAKCLETPSEILLLLGKDGFVNPHYPRREFEQYFNNPVQLIDESWAIFRSPLLTSEDIARFSESEDREIRGLALKSRHGDPKKLIKYVQEVLKNPVEETPNCFSSILRESVMSDELFELLSAHLDRQTGNYAHYPTVGAALRNNTTLTDEQQTFLTLAGIELPSPANRADYSVSSYYLSSFAWIPLFKDFKTDIPKLAAGLGEVNHELISTLSDYGHPYSILVPGELSHDFVPTYDALHDLIEPKYVHRLFWTELCERPDFEIYRRNAYRTDDLFITHPILGRDFEDHDSETASGLGGVFDFNEQPWLVGTEELNIEVACEVVTLNEETMVDTHQSFDHFDDLGARLCALTKRELINEEEYGFSLTSTAEKYVIDAGDGYAELNDLDVSASLNSEFDEMLSWRKTPDSKKNALFDLLIMGRNIPGGSKLKADSDHFLGCMALHESTPDFLLKKLSALNDPLIDEVIASR